MMKKLISPKFAGHGMLILLAFGLIYHLLALAKVIPLDMVWGGKLKSYDELMPMEMVSLVTTVIVSCIVAIRLGYIKLKVNSNVIQIGFWALATLFLLNTLGNIKAVNKWEALIFTPITLLLALFSIILALNPPPPTNK